MLVGGVYTLLIAFEVRHLAISYAESGSAVTGAILIGYGVSNIWALLYPLDLNNDAAVHASQPRLARWF